MCVHFPISSFPSWSWFFTPPPSSLFLSLSLSLSLSFHPFLPLVKTNISYFYMVVLKKLTSRIPLVVFFFSFYFLSSSLPRLLFSLPLYPHGRVFHPLISRYVFPLDDTANTTDLPVADLHATAYLNTLKQIFFFFSLFPPFFLFPPLLKIENFIFIRFCPKVQEINRWHRR